MVVVAIPMIGLSVLAKEISQDLRHEPYASGHRMGWRRFAQHCNESSRCRSDGSEKSHSVHLPKALQRRLKSRMSLPYLDSPNLNVILMHTFAANVCILSQ